MNYCYCMNKFTASKQIYFFEWGLALGDESSVL